ECRGLRQPRGMGALGESAAGLRGRDGRGPDVARRRALGPPEGPVPVEARLGGRGSRPGQRVGVEPPERLVRPGAGQGKGGDGQPSGRGEVLREGRVPDRPLPPVGVGARMTTIERRGSLAAGFSAIGGGLGIVVLLTAATVILSILAAAPLGPALEDSFGRTLAGGQLLHNHPLSAAANVVDFVHEKAPAISGVRAASRWAALLILLQQILVAGGIVAVLGKAGGFTAGEFAWGVRRNAWHNVKCFLIFLLLAGLSIGLWVRGVLAVSTRAFEDAAPGAPARLAVRIAGIVVALLLYAVFSLLHDFARAARRFDNSVGAWRAYGGAPRALSGRWFRALRPFPFWLLL